MGTLDELDEKFDLPPKGEIGETRFGFVINQEVEIIKDRRFRGWRGKIWAFCGSFVFVNLTHPKKLNLWFFPKNLKAIPK